MITALPCLIRNISVYPTVLGWYVKHFQTILSFCKRKKIVIDTRMWEMACIDLNI